MKSIGLRFLSWAFYHATSDERICDSIENRGSFIDIVELLAPKYYKFSGVEQIEWRSPSASVWEEVLMKADNEDRRVFTSK